MTQQTVMPSGNELTPVEFEPVYRGRQEHSSPSILVPHISPERVATYTNVDVNKIYPGFCGDERSPTAESVASNSLRGYTAKEFYRIFGALYGLAKNAGVSIAADYGVDELKKYGETFIDFKDKFANRILDLDDDDVNKVIFGVHSDLKNENNPHALHEDNCGCLGCLYATYIGKIGLLNFNDQDVNDLAREEQKELFGSADGLIDVIKANESFVELYGFNEHTSLDRTSAPIDDKTPVSILAGEHANIDEGVIVAQNFHRYKISNPALAVEAQVPFYAVDSTTCAAIIINAFRGEIDIKPNTVLRSIDQDTRATRAALAARESRSVREMPLQRYGRADYALNYLMAA